MIRNKVPKEVSDRVCFVCVCACVHMHVHVCVYCVYCVCMYVALVVYLRFLLWV